MKKGAIFDMDGLLFDTEKVYQNNWTAIAAEMGFELPDSFRREICGTSGALMNSVIAKYYPTDDPQKIQEDEMRRVHEDLEKEVPEKPGIREILSFFRDKQYMIAVASSTPTPQIIKNLEKAGIREYFDAVVSGKDVVHGKPAPDIFLLAAEKIGCDPADCFVFEDAYNGVRSGHASGAKVIMIPDTQQPDDEMERIAWKICPDLIAAKEMLEKMI